MLSVLRSFCTHNVSICKLTFHWIVKTCQPIAVFDSLAQEVRHGHVDAAILCHVFAIQKIENL